MVLPHVSSKHFVGQFIDEVWNVRAQALLIAISGSDPLWLMLQTTGQLQVTLCLMCHVTDVSACAVRLMFQVAVQQLI